ncbi:hypothetical protein CEXT_253051 [Caerostris extrusa]|uniref:Uncharacterized protein n=1 Tax=Caerostris extrusa TaxID=172846 RepID=A0AAV4TLP8_CAEEX|nr:hypothetical protein CEXT_253051 [Caerostris extrusa]
MSPCSPGIVALDDGKQKWAKLVIIIKDMEITDSQIALSRSATGLISEFQRNALELLVKLEVKKNLQPWPKFQRPLKVVIKGLLKSTPTIDLEISLLEKVLLLKKANLRKIYF